MAIMKIRRLEDSDIASCLDIYNYYIANTCYTLEEDSLTLDEFKERCKSIKSKYPYIVAENNEGNVIGYAYLSPFITRSAFRITADLSIYVSSKHTNEHIGGLLLSKIEELALKNGITNIISIVTSTNETSKSFHEKNGFILEGVIHDVAIKFGEVLSVNYYRKHLEG